jgi:methionyl-tRNA formyltransferase
MNSGLCFIGSNGLFSLTALQTLLARHIPIHHIILAGYAPATPPSRGLSIAPPATTADMPTIPALAARHRIPIHYAGHDIQHFARWPDFPHHCRPEYLFVACFPFRLPDALLQWPTRMAINLHPSLLPAYRGPSPVFWQLRNGERRTGISLHLLTEALDAGPILLQKQLSFPPGATPGELDMLLALQGTEVLCDNLCDNLCDALCDTILTQTLKPREQDPQTARYQPLPTPEDYVLDNRWSAERAYNFMRGTHSPADGYPILVDGQWHRLHTALSFDGTQSLGTRLGRHLSQQGEALAIQFSPGVLRAKPV